MREKFAGGASSEFFELLGEFARDADLAVRRDVDASSERFGQPIRRFEKDRCFFALSSGAQLAFASPALNRKKPAEAKFFC